MYTSGSRQAKWSNLFHFANGSRSFLRVDSLPNVMGIYHEIAPSYIWRYKIEVSDSTIVSTFYNRTHQGHI